MIDTNYEKYSRVRCVGTAKRISKYGESLEDACKRTALSVLGLPEEIIIQDIGEDETYTSWYDVLFGYCEHFNNVDGIQDGEYVSPDIYFVVGEQLYEIVEQKVTPVGYKVETYFDENDDIKFDIEFSPTDDIPFVSWVLDEQFNGVDFDE